MRLLALDYETFFSAEYSLSRGGATTESYIRHELFKAHGVAYRWADTNEHGWVTHADLPKFFASVDWANTCMLAHHNNFDGLITTHHYGARPAMYACTKAMGNLVLPTRSKRLDDLATYFNLPNKVVPYNAFRGVRDLWPTLEHEVANGAIHDTLLNLEIFKRMIAGDPSRDMPAFPRAELAIVSETIKLFTEPVLHIDIGRAQGLADRIALQKETVLDQLGLDRDVLASRECFADLLRELGIEPPTKTSKATGEATYAFGKNDSGMKALLEADNEIVSALVAAKLGVASSINETRARRYAGIGTRGNPAPIYLNYCAAFSTRWGGGDKANWQNLERLPNKKDGEFERNAAGYIRKGEIRLCLKAPPGHKLVIADLSQIEARTLAWHAGQEDLLEAFRDAKRDVYSEFIEPYYGYPVSKATPSERGVGKQLILSCGYQSGAQTIKTTAALGSYGPPVLLTLEEADQLKVYYRKKNYKIPEHWKRAEWIIDVLAAKGRAEWGPVTIDNGRVWLPNQAWLDYSTLHRSAPDEFNPRGQWQITTRKGPEKLYSGKLTAHVNSALARVVMTDAMHVIAPRYKIALTVHDELALCVPEDQAEEARAFALAVMTREPVWARGLPVAAECGIDSVYSK